MREEVCRCGRVEVWTYGKFGDAGRGETPPRLAAHTQPPRPDVKGARSTYFGSTR